MFKSLVDNKQILVYSSQIISMVSSMMVGKLIAIKIIPQEYGSYILQFALVTFNFNLFITPSSQYFKKQIIEAYTSKLFGINFLFLLIGVSIAAIVFAILYLFEFIKLTELILFIFYIISFLVFNLAKDTCIVKGMFKEVTLLQILYSTLYLIITFALITFFPYSEAIWTSLIVSNFFAFFFIKYYIMKKGTIEDGSIVFKVKLVEKQVARTYFNYTSPLIALTCFGWLIMNIDKFFIANLINVADAGKYSMSYNLASKFAILVIPVNTLFSQKVYEQINSIVDIKEIKATFNTAIKQYLKLAIPALILTSLSYKIIGDIFLSEEYKDAFFLIPLIACAFLFNSIIVLLESFFYAHGSTNRMLIHNIIGAIFNVSLNMLLIPFLGILGAALTMVVSNGVQLIVTFLLYRRTLNRNYVTIN